MASWSYQGNSIDFIWTYVKNGYRGIIKNIYLQVEFSMVWKTINCIETELKMDDRSFANVNGTLNAVNLKVWRFER